MCFAFCLFVLQKPVVVDMMPVCLHVCVFLCCLMCVHVFAVYMYLLCVVCFFVAFTCDVFA